VKIIQELLAKGITVDILNMGRIDDSPMGRLMVTMLLAFAEFERSQIVERTQTGRKIAMANGQQMGRPQKYNQERMKTALALLDAGNSYTKVEAMTGISKSTLIRHRKVGADDQGRA
jgi:DNA invertase Pin-like site-specific DNA recombinase